MGLRPGAEGEEVGVLGLELVGEVGCGGEVGGEGGGVQGRVQLGEGGEEGGGAEGAG